MRRHPRPKIALAFLAALWCMAGVSQSEEDELLARGRLLYRIYCRNCHGEEGKGDGNLASILKVQPSDLTRLSRSNDGEFPFERLYQTIDGREEVPGHGAREMPIWGLSFREREKDVEQQDEVRGKILQLIHYLKSIQENHEAAGG